MFLSGMMLRSMTRTIWRNRLVAMMPLFDYYLREHALKATLDVGYGLEPVDDFWTSRGAGWEDDRAGEDGQVVTRLQFQLLF